MGDLTASTSLTVWPHPVTAEGRQTPPVLISVRPGRDIFRSIALIALAVVAPILAPLIFPTLGATALAFATTGIVTVGGLLINALIPIRAPDLGGVENVPLEPVYSLSGGGNRARLYEPLPLVLGRHRVFPDLAAAGFTEFVNGEQFLAQVFHFGLGNIDIEDLRIGTSPLSSYEDVTTRIARGTAVTIFPGNVDTIAGAMLDDTDWVTRVTAANTDRIAIDIVGDLFAIDDGSAILAREVDIVIQWRPRGAASAWSDETVTIRNQSRSPVRRTIPINLNGPAEWEVRVRRTSEPRDGTRERDQIQFAALRASQPDTGDYAGQTRLALRVRASGQLSGRLDRLSALVHQKVPVYRNGAWTTGNERSSNPAAIFRWYARGIFVRGRAAMTWEMSHEGRAFMKGDVVMVTHSLIDGGMVGRVARLHGADITLDRAVGIGSGAWLAVRRQDGRLHMSRVDRAVAGLGPTRDLTLRKPVEDPADTEPRDVLWRLHDTSLPPRRVRITGVEPIDDRRFKFTAIDEDENYHLAATSDLSVPLPDIMPRMPRVVTVSITENPVRMSAGYAVEIEAVLTVTGGLAWRVRDDVD